MRKLLTVAAVLTIAVWGALKIAPDANARMSWSSDDDGGAKSTRSFALTGFDRIALRGSDDMRVQVGPAASVTVTGPAGLLDRVEADVRDGELRVGRKRNRSWSLGWSWEDSPVVYTVTVPQLAGAAVAGSAEMTVDRVDSPNFRGAVAGSGSLVVGALRAQQAEFRIAGSGDARVSGQAEAVDVSVAGSGDYDGQGLKSARAQLKVAGSGDLSATVEGPAEVSVMGSGDVEVHGKPVCQVKKMGSGDVRCPA